jgi:hypothetical protein
MYSLWLVLPYEQTLVYINLGLPNFGEKLLSLSEFSMRNMVRPFWVFGGDGADDYINEVFTSPHPGSLFILKLLSILHSFFTLACLSLFAFSLKRRFGLR